MQPKTLVGLGAGISLLLLLLSIADWREVTALVARLTPGVLALIAVIHVVGFGCRAARWLLMLRAGGVMVPRRRALAAYFGSELLGPLPASPFVASYLLHRSGAARVWATAPVLFAGLWVDVVVVVGGTAAVPDGAPLPVRLAAATLCGGAVLAVLAIHWSPAQRLVDAAARKLARTGRRAWPRGERWWRLVDTVPMWRSQHVAAAFGVGALIPGIALTALPMALGTNVTAVVASTLGFPGLTAPRAWAAAGTMLVLGLLSPLPFDLGVSEGAGVLAYGWLSIPPAAALAMALLGRVTGITFGFTLTAIATWLLRDELA
ncbi:MAG: flippase-like domain-containing protein [Chloroflexi bacterium]|nr:flippase-like domain-containing protein [Chloroflexota bacterium]